MHLAVPQETLLKHKRYENACAIRKARTVWHCTGLLATGIAHPSARGVYRRHLKNTPIDTPIEKTMRVKKHLRPASSCPNHTTRQARPRELVGQHDRHPQPADALTIQSTPNKVKAQYIFNVPSLIFGASFFGPPQSCTLCKS